MIEIKNLYKRYHNHHGSDWVLKDINLTIPTGVSVGLIGRNGAGKSTLLRLIAGMDTPDRGEVIRHSRVSWPVGLAGGMQNNMTGRQNAKFVARAQGCGPEEVNRVIEFVQDFAEIGEAFDEPVRTYSSGMRSRLSFGLSLSFDFDVYISDEATAVGDRSFKAKAQALFKEKVGKASLIMVSHGEGILRDLCQVGIYIKDGQAYWYDDINEAILAYHTDVDEQKQAGVSGEDESTHTLDGDPATFNKAQVQELQKKLKQARQYMNGIGQRLQQAKHEKWPKEEVQLLNHLRLEANEQVTELREILNQTSIGARQSAKMQIGQAQLSINAFTQLLEKAETENWKAPRKATIEKALKNAHLQKEQAETALEAMDGLD
ncbi:ABC transporter ATP-binding protein [Halomonas sp. CnH100-B]|uniref:ABC transporter ATP-binding protein n=1 Tax=Halomonas sp. CnH100-B TaxID=2954490 RepID=UPI0020980BFD|nr:ABC transporter ATP-binding protein [Halomonas sp. CnH100-B]MCO7227689.1 ABC transporter ATP-binding protein [Halomonas sp. CnH100-B]